MGTDPIICNLALEQVTISIVLMAVMVKKRVLEDQAAGKMVHQLLD